MTKGSYKEFYPLIMLNMNKNTFNIYPNNTNKYDLYTT